MQIKKSQYILTLIGAFLLGVVLIGGISAYKLSAAGSGTNAATGVNNTKLEEIKGYIDQYYLNDYDEEDLVEGAYKGYVSALGDPYTTYMDKESYENWKVTATGEYSGVGITFSADEEGNYVVVSIAKDSPAEKAGFKSGDILLTVNGKSFDDMDLMASEIRGDAGTKVKITYYRDGKEKSATMVREKINQESVEYKMLDSTTGYIKITQFITNTGDDFDAALKTVQKKGAKKLVLDLRDNGGGLVDESVKVADEFLDEGVVCYVEDKNGNRDTYDAEDGKTDLETVVLVNENSASASEILSAALQDNGYKIVGQTTFGKGVIQTTIDMDDGSALKVTIMQYLSPKEHVIQKKGITPDYKVKDKAKTDEDEQLEKAEEILK